MKCGDRDFNIDQGEAAGRFFNLNEFEKEYLILMIEYARAGTEQSKAFFLRLLNERKNKHFKLKNQVAIEADLSEQEKAVYCSDFLYSAIHMLVTIPEFSSLELIAEQFRVSRVRVEEICNFLIKKNMIKKENGKLLPSVNHLFLDKDSPHIIQHHTNYRLKAIEEIRSRKQDQVHLSMSFSVSESDAVKIKQHLSRTISKISSLVKKSKEEKLMVLNVDCF